MKRKPGMTVYFEDEETRREFQIKALKSKQKMNDLIRRWIQSYLLTGKPC